MSEIIDGALVSNDQRYTLDGYVVNEKEIDSNIEIDFDSLFAMETPQFEMNADFGITEEIKNVAQPIASFIHNGAVRKTNFDHIYKGTLIRPVVEIVT
jgi:hypothetical protein